jgi:hypothetical protein
MCRPVEVVERLSPARFGGGQHRLTPGLHHGRPRTGQLDLLDTFVGDHEDDVLAGQLVSHGLPLS